MLCTGLNLAAHLASSHHWSQSVKDTIWPDMGAPFQRPTMGLSLRAGAAEYGLSGWF